jgi:hypothetical protein
MAKPFALPPGVDERRLRVMRYVLRAAYHDPAFLAEAEAMRFHFQPKKAAETYHVSSEVLAAPPDIAAKYRKIIQP